MTDPRSRVRRALSRSPHENAARVRRRLVGAAKSLRERVGDRVTPTYPTSRPRDDLVRFLSPAAPSDLGRDIDHLRIAASHYLDHRFDVLGSGWMVVRHGAKCRGLRGHRYPADETVDADRAGAWIGPRLNRSNRRASRRLWKMVTPGYQPIDWHLDVRSGFRWAEDTWFKDVRYGHLPGVDVKVPWELARSQHLPQLALAHASAEEGVPGFESPERYVQEVVDQILDFSSSNPPRYGVNWALAMDVGIRGVNWCIALDLLKAQGASIGGEMIAELTGLIRTHGRFVREHLEWDPVVRGNHYLANICSLLILGAYLPSDEETDHWITFAHEELLTEFQRQFHEDGSNFEASLCYHRLATEMVLWAVAFALAIPEHRWALPVETRFPSWFATRLSLAGRVVGLVVRPDGRVPQLGDNDSGRFIALVPAWWSLPVTDARERWSNLEGYDELADDSPYLAVDDLDHQRLAESIHAVTKGGDGVGAGLEDVLLGDLSGSPLPCDVPPPAIQAGSREDVDRRLVDLDGTRREYTLHVDGSSLRNGVDARALPDLGLYVLRSDRVYLAFRCGPVGQAGNGGHAHNDQLAIEFALDGVVVLEDRGTYLYTPLPELRNAYRSAWTHAVPRIGQLEPASLDRGLFTLPDPGARCVWFDSVGMCGIHHGYGGTTLRLMTLEEHALTVFDIVPCVDGGKQDIQRSTDDVDTFARWLLPEALPVSPRYGVVDRA